MHFDRLFHSNPGMAHCLLAHTMERQKKLAITEWKKCQELGSMTSPDEDALLYHRVSSC